MESRVLVPVLNWGFGHATRMVPVISALGDRNARVVLAGSGAASDYLSKKFPDLEMEKLPEAEVHYSSAGAARALWKRAIRQPTINAAQNKHIVELVEKYEATHIISDNVYGAYSEKIPAALITHQLAPKSPWVSGLIHRKLAGWLNKFDAVWIPDESEEETLAGELLDNPHYRGRYEYLGRLSRFQRQTPAGKNIAVTILLGGPEPQRSIFENLAVNICKTIPGKKVVLFGQPDRDEAIPDGDFESVPFADGIDFQSYLRRSELVLARSGFSSLCDLIAIGAKACVVPTPQQTEQEYLAKRVEALGWFASAEQRNLSAEVLLRARNFDPPRNGKSRLETVLDEFLST